MAELSWAFNAPDSLVEDAVVWASQHGLLVGLKREGIPDAAVIHAPLTIKPTPFPKKSFEKAKRAATVFNELMDRVSQDSSYLQKTLSLAAEHDDFTAKLLKIHRDTENLRRANESQQVVLAINRADYMLDEPSTTMLQVEVNVIASSFGCLSTLVGRLHRYILERSSASDQVLECLPPNAATTEVAQALAEAVTLQGIPGAAVLMVVQPGETNSYDQQWIQTTLWEVYKIRTLRRSLREIHETARLGPNRSLSIEETPIAVVYYRAGYSPDDYTSPEDWQARQVMEGSAAVQCPSVAYQLAGAKKVQQDLASPVVLERFLDNPDDIELARSCFAGLWSLDELSDPDVKDVVEAALRRPDDFVLKPQREGGGNNLYGDELKAKLSSRRGLSAFILMQRIRPPVHKTQMVREGKLLEVDSISEVGIYGTFLRKGKEILFNKEAGHLVRTKAATSDEGGVAAGFAVLDSPFLTAS